MQMPWSDPTFRGRWGKIGGVVLLVATLAGIAAVAGSCSFLPRLLPVQAGRGTPTATVSPVTGQPAIEIAPVAGDAGTRITVTGRGWRPADTVFVRLEDGATGEVPGLDQASAIVTDRGDFVVRFTYPYDPRWALMPRALVTVIDPATGQRASAEFRILNPAPASPTPLPTLVPATPVPTELPPTAVIPTKAAPQPTGQVTQPTATRVPPTATRLPPTATRVPPTPVPPTATPVPVITDWRGEYWANLNLAGNPTVVRNDYAVDFSWGFGSPAAQVPPDSFSARWTRTLDFQAGTYRFYLSMDDGARLWIDGQLVIDQWSNGSVREVTADRSLTQGRHDIRVEYYELTGLARVALRWERTGDMTFPDWRGEYWNNPNLSGAPVLVRNDRIIDFNWGDGSPAPGSARRQLLGALDPHVHVCAGRVSFLRAIRRRHGGADRRPVRARPVVRSKRDHAVYCGREPGRAAPGLGAVLRAYRRGVRAVLVAAGLPAAHCDADRDQRAADGDVHADASAAQRDANQHVRASDGDGDRHGDIDIDYRADADLDADVDANAYADVDCNGYADAQPDGGPNRHRYGDGHRDADGDCDADREPDDGRVGDADKHGDADSSADRDRDAYRDGDRTADKHADRAADKHADRAADKHADRAADKHADAHGYADGNGYRDGDRDEDADGHGHARGDRDAD